MRARAALVIAAAMLFVTGCDPTLPFRALNEAQPIANLAFGDSTGSTIASGNPTGVDVTLLDRAGNVIDTAKQVVAWKSSDESIVVVSGTSAHVEVTGKKVGTATITATANEKSATLSVTVTPGTPTQIVADSGSGQLAVAGQPFLNNFVARVLDAAGNAVGAGVGVSWQAGTSASVIINTNATGRSAATVTAGTGLGALSITATLSADATVKVVFPATITTLELGIVTAPPATAVNGVALSPAPTVQLRYASDHSAYKRSGVTMTASSTTGVGPAFTGATATTDANGLATFAGLVLTGTAGPVTIRFTTTTPAGTVDASSATTLGAGAVAKLAFTIPPSASSISGSAMAQPAIVQLQDASGNSVSTAGVQVSASVISPAAGVTLANASATTDANGRATFTTLSATGAVSTSFTLRFSSTGLTAVDAVPATLTGPATKWSLTQSPSTALCGATLTSFVLRLQDASNNSVFQSGVIATLSATAGATVSGAATATTDVTGTATFASRSITVTAAGSYSLTFSTTGLTAAATSIPVSANVATALQIVTQPSTTVVDGAVLAAVPVVRLIDVCTLPVSQSGVAVTVAATVGSPTFSSTTASTAANGQATFAGLSITGLVGSYTLVFSSGTLTAATATTATAVTIGAASKLVLTTVQSSSAQSNVAFATQPVAQITDVGSNTIASSGVTVSVTANGTSIGSQTTDAQGKATFAGLKIVGIAGSYALNYVSNPLTTAQSTVTLGGTGTASQMVLTTQPATGSLGTGVTLARTPIVQLQDATGTNVSLAGVAISVPISAGGTVTPSSLTTGGTGAADFSSMIVSGSVSTAYTLTFQLTGLSSISPTTPTTVATTLTKGAAPVSVPSGSAATPRYYGIVVTAAASPLTVTLSGTAANVDLYVRLTDAPTTSTFTCSSTGVGTTKTCVIPGPVNGQHYYILLNGTAAYSGATLTVNW